MQTLIEAAQEVLAQDTALPFAAIHSVKEQHIVNVPVMKPMLICILDGYKKLGQIDPIECAPGEFVFLSNQPKIEMRNVPSAHHYFALVIEFENQDFDCLPTDFGPTAKHITGTIDTTFGNTLLQFVQWCAFAPQALWPLRRQELLLTLHHLGYTKVSQLRAAPSISHQLHALLNQNIAANISSAELAESLAMSESTLRRKLSDAGLNLQTIKENIRMGHGLGLLQSTNLPINHIAEQCGYASQSRFTDKFKQRFGLTPTELRKTRLID
ncbi:helix-turn-helix transcriptional regulator [Halioxenophilus aromaticivorans]|uniref:HTH araC/xylS-type domain-containing protein n=1 Tax=Halioxenophilus aromaticivorans TaxID=1306992 RepID=A0AAV3U668_9ALTE